MNEIFISIPNLLLIVLLQAILGQASVWVYRSSSADRWMSIAKVVRTEVRVLRGSEYVQARGAWAEAFFTSCASISRPIFFRPFYLWSS